VSNGRGGWAKPGENNRAMKRFRYESQPNVKKKRIQVEEGRRRRGIEETEVLGLIRKEGDEETQGRSGVRGIGGTKTTLQAPSL